MKVTVLCLFFCTKFYIASDKEVIYLSLLVSLSVCMSVCLSVNTITQNFLDSFYRAMDVGQTAVLLSYFVRLSVCNVVVI